MEPKKQLFLQKIIFEMVQKHDLKGMKTLHKKEKFPLNFRFKPQIDDCQFSLIHQIIDEHAIEIFNYFLEEGSLDINYQHPDILDNNPPLFMAIWRGLDEIALKIIEKGGDIKLLNNNKEGLWDIINNSIDSKKRLKKYQQALNKRNFINKLS